MFPIRDGWQVFPTASAEAAIEKPPILKMISIILRWTIKEIKRGGHGDHHSGRRRDGGTGK